MKVHIFYTIICTVSQPKVFKSFTQITLKTLYSLGLMLNLASSSMSSSAKSMQGCGAEMTDALPDALPVLLFQLEEQTLFSHSFS